MKKTLCGNVIATDHTKNPLPDAAKCCCTNRSKAKQSAVAIGGEGPGSFAIAINLVLQSNICDNKTDVDLDPPPFTLVFDGLNVPEGINAGNSDQVKVTLNGKAVDSQKLVTNAETVNGQLMIRLAPAKP